MVSGKRNRAAGHKFERECVKLLREIGFTDVVSSRSANRARDAQKIDLVNQDEIKSGRLPWAIQCKNVKGHLKYAPVLAEMPDETNITKVVFHNQTEKVKDRFVTKNQFAILYLPDFIHIMHRLKLQSDRLNETTSNKHTTANRERDSTTAKAQSRVQS
jgi:hypothetical protein